MRHAGRTHSFPHERPLRPSGQMGGAAWEVIALLAVLAVAFLVRTVFLGVRPAWMDGAYILEAARAGAVNIVLFLQSPQSHEIAAYRSLLTAWVRWLPSLAAPSRELSLLYGLVAVYLTWRVGRLLFSAPIGILAAGLVALNPFQVIVSNQVGNDMALESLVLLSILILARGLEWPGSIWYWVVYGACIALLARMSPYVLLLLPAQALCVFFRRPVRQAIEYLCVAGVAGLAVQFLRAPHVFVLPSISIVQGQSVHFDYILTMIATQTFGGYVVTGGSYGAVWSHMDPTYQSIMLMPILGLMAVGAFPLGRTDRWAQTLVALSWTVPVVLVALISPALGSVAAYPRDLFFLQPFAALLLAAGVARLRESLRHAPQPSPQPDRA